MAKREVTITFSIDPKEYEGVADTDSNAIILALEMMQEGTDWPDGKVTVRCGPREVVVPDFEAFEPDDSGTFLRTK